MSILYQEPRYLSVDELRDKTGWSIAKIAAETDIEQRRLYRLRHRPTEEYMPEAKLFALTYKASQQIALTL